MMRVLGIDILSGSPFSKTPPRYSVAMLEGNSFVFKDEVSKHKLKVLIKSASPERIACDNIFELFQKEEVIRFFTGLPSHTQVIQVNGHPGKMEPLHVVAKRNGINITSKANSMEEAMACAMLASRNVGSEAKAFHDKYMIIISRARSMGRGGQSMERYRRKVHSMVSANVKGIASILDEKGVAYNLSVVKADSGLSRGVFEVAGPREKLAGIRPQKGPDVQVKIRPKVREKLEFVPLQAEKKSVILGADPGLTVGLAVVDLDGNLLEVFSARDFSLGDILNYCTKYIDIAVVASDVTPAPKLVEKIAGSIDAIVFTPPHALSVEEKQNIVDEKFSREVYSNAHERDATAAAIKAYNSYRNKLENLEKRLSELHLLSLRGDVRRMVLKGMSLDNAIKQLTEVKEEPSEERVPEVTIDEHRGIIKTLRAEIALLKTEKDSLATELEENKSRIKHLEIRLHDIGSDESRRLRKEKEMRLKEKEIFELRSSLNVEKRKLKGLEVELEKLRKSRLIDISGKIVVAKVIKNFTRAEVSALISRFKEGEVLYIVDAGGGGKEAAEELVRLRPSAVVTDLSKTSHLARESLRKIPVIPPDRLGIKILGEVALIDRESLWSEVEKEKKRMESAEDARMGAWLEEYVEKYRGERRG